MSEGKQRINSMQGTNGSEIVSNNTRFSWAMLPYLLHRLDELVDDIRAAIPDDEAHSGIFDKLHHMNCIIFESMPVAMQVSYSKRGNDKC